MGTILYHQYRGCEITNNVSHHDENIGSALSDRFELVVSDMQLDISRQFSILPTCVVHWARKSDWVVVTDVEVNFGLDEGQLTGRILVFAVGAGKAAVSIPYWAAKELFENRRALLVAFSDSKSLSKTTAESIGKKSQIAEMQSREYDCGMKSMPRPKVDYQWYRMPCYWN